MLVISRHSVGMLLSVLKKSVPRGSPQPKTVEIEADRRGLRYRWGTPEVAVEHCDTGRRPSAHVLMPVEAFAALRGRKGEVILSPSQDGTTLARWDEGTATQVKEYTSTHFDDTFPALPRRFTSQPIELIRAIRDSVSMTGDAGRYNMHRIRFGGDSGEVTATDGRALLIQGGFTFPWTDDLLVAATRVFSSREFTDITEVSVGVTDSHVCVRTGSWTLWLAIDTEARFPPVEDVVRSVSTGETECRFSEADVSSLTSVLSTRKGKSEPLTIVLADGGVLIRAGLEGSNQPAEWRLDSSAPQFSPTIGEPPGSNQPAEWRLDSSSQKGPAITLVSDRDHLVRLLTLGFRSFQISQADAPLMCREGERTFVCMPLDPDSALRSAPDVSDQRPCPNRKIIETKPQQSEVQMNGRHQDQRQASDGSNDKNNGSSTSLLAEAESLKADLREAYSRVVRLVDALKRQRRQSRLVRSTLESLKQLPNIE